MVVNSTECDSYLQCLRTKCVSDYNVRGIIHNWKVMRDTYGTSIVSKYNSDFGEVSPKRLRGDIAHPFPP